MNFQNHPLLHSRSQDSSIHRVSLCFFFRGPCQMALRCFPLSGMDTVPALSQGSQVATKSHAHGALRRPRRDWVRWARARRLHTRQPQSCLLRVYPHITSTPWIPRYHRIICFSHRIASLQVIYTLEPTTLWVQPSQRWAIDLPLFSCTQSPSRNYFHPYCHCMGDLDS